jgi:WD40 repeat protein
MPATVAVELPNTPGPIDVDWCGSYSGHPDVLLHEKEILARDRIREFRHGSAVFGTQFSPKDGKTIVTSSFDRFARVFDVASGEEIFKTPEHGGRLFKVSLIGT